MLKVLDKDMFWDLIEQSKVYSTNEAKCDFISEKLTELGADAAFDFITIYNAYEALSYKYGLWTAATAMCGGFCSDDGFIDFRGWLISQGKDVYFAALANPDSLADVDLEGHPDFEDLKYVGYDVYENLTGEDAYSRDDPDYQLVKTDLARDIHYGEGIDEQYSSEEALEYIPNVCSKYLSEEEMENYQAGDSYYWSD